MTSTRRTSTTSTSSTRTTRSCSCTGSMAKQPHAGLGDVHGQRDPGRRPVADRVGRPADDVARPQRPLLLRIADDGSPRVARVGRRRRQLRRGHVPPRAATNVRWCTSGSSRTSAGRSPASRESVPAPPPRPTCEPTSARPTTTPRITEAAAAETLPVRPGLAHRPVRGRRCHSAAAGVRRERRCQNTGHPASGSGRTRPSPRPPASVRSGTGSQGHEHYINWNWINDTTYLDPDFPGSLVYRAAAGRQQAPRVGDVHAPRRRQVGGRAGLRRRPHAMARPRQPVLHRPPGRTAGGRPFREPNGECLAPKVVRAQSPMIHVWIGPPTSAGRSPPSKASVRGASPPAKSDGATTPTAQVTAFSRRGQLGLSCVARRRRPWSDGRWRAAWCSSLVRPDAFGHVCGYRGRGRLGGDARSG